MIAKKYLRPPALSLRFFPFWRRNLLVWKKLAAAEILGNLADPMLYMLGLGFGIGAMLPDVDGVSYITFLAGGTVCYSTMNSATFEVLYSAFSRMHAQKTWDAILNAPLALDDIVFGELVWAACKSFLTCLAVLIVIWVFNISRSPMMIWTIPLSLLIGFCFAGMGLVMTALSPNYNFFVYYFTLVITPMTLLSGVFFPTSQLPTILQSISSVLPLTSAIELARPLLSGKVPPHILSSATLLAAYGAVGFYIALILSRRRLLK